MIHDDVRSNGMKQWKQDINIQVQQSLLVITTYNNVYFIKSIVLTHSTTILVFPVLLLWLRIGDVCVWVTGAGGGRGRGNIDPISRGESESGSGVSSERRPSLVRSGQRPILIGWHWPGGEVCRRINETHLLSQTPAPAEVRRETKGCWGIIAVGFFGLIDN